MTAFNLGLHLDRRTVGKAEEQAALGSSKRARWTCTNVRSGVRRQLVDLAKVVGLTEQRGLPHQDRNLEMEPT